MNTARISVNGDEQSVRLPADCRFKGNEVFIKKIGEVVVLIPKKNTWDSLIQSLEKFSDDFMSQRDQPVLSERELMTSTRIVCKKGLS